MLITLSLSFIFTVLGLATFFLPTVTELPFGIDPYVEGGISSFRAFMEVFPFAETPFYLFLGALGISFLMYSWKWVKWFIELIRG